MIQYTWYIMIISTRSKLQVALQALTPKALLQRCTPLWDNLACENCEEDLHYEIYEIMQ